MLNKCTYNSQYIAHYAQVEPTIMLTKTDMRLSYTISSATISVLSCARIRKWVPAD